jgi:hypothetical protein
MVIGLSIDVMKDGGHIRLGLILANPFQNFFSVLSLFSNNLPQWESYFGFKMTFLFYMAILYISLK